MIASSASRIPALTGIRIIPATMIFFYHWLFDATDAWPSFARAIFKQGYLAVAIFFATTGFLVTIRYAQRLPTLQYGRFVWQRIVRIYPLYWVVLTGFAVALGRPVGIIPQNSGDLLILYAMLQSFFPPLLLAGLQTAWTLTISEMFYWAAPFILRCLPLPLSIGQWLLRMCALVVLGIGLAYLLSQLPTRPGTLLGAPIGYLLFRTVFGRLSEFLCGMLAGLIYLRLTTPTPELPNNLASGLIGVGIGLIWLLAVSIDSLGLSEASSPLFFILNASVAAATAILLLGLACDTQLNNFVTRALSSRFMVFLGQISYALFLIQLTEPCQWLYWVGLGQYGGIEGRWPRALLLYIAALAISAALYQVIERPIAYASQRARQ